MNGVIMGMFEFIHTSRGIVSFLFFQTGLGYARGEMILPLALDLVIMVLDSRFSTYKHVSRVESIWGVKSQVRNCFLGFLLGIRISNLEL